MAPDELEEIRAPLGRGIVRDGGPTVSAPLQETAEVTGQYSGTSDEITDLDRFLAVLTEEERAVMILAYACGMSHREISDTADLPVGTVKSIIFRGKEKIRDRFEISDHKHG